METKVTIPALQKMKREGRKIVGVGASVGVNLWGHATDAEVTVDEMLICCKAVRRGAKHALVSCDIPNGPAQAGTEAAVSAAVRLGKEGGADMVKVLGDPGVVKAIVRAGVSVFAEFHGEKLPVDKLVEEAKRLEEAGASVLDFRHSGPVAGPAVVSAVSIPVIGGLGGGPWLDGRVRLAHTAIGYAAKWIDAKTETYGNVAKLSFDAFRALIDDVRSGRQIKGG